MNIKKYLYSGILLLSGWWTASCTEQFETPSQGGDNRGVISGQIAHFMVDGESSSVEGEDQITEMKACVFDNGELVKVYENIQVADGSFKLTVEETSGTLYLVANAVEAGAWHDMNAGELTEEDWKQRIVSLKDNKVVSYFTGSLQLDDYLGNGSAPLVLTRGVARFDLSMGTNEGIELKSIRLEHVANKAYFLPQSVVSSPATEFVAMEKSFTEPIAENKLGLFYVYEQASEDMKVVLDVMVDGAPKTLETALPTTGIKRNAVYTLNLHRNAVSVKVDEWNYVDDIPLNPDYTDKITVDTEHSVLPGAEITSDGTGLNLSYLSSEMKLYVTSKNELEVIYQGDEMVTVTPLVKEDGSVERNAFRVVKKLSPIGYTAKPSAIQFRRKGMTEVYEEDRITLNLEENPTTVSGDLKFDLNGVCNFGKYVDNGLGSFVVQEGKELVIELGDEDPWLKAEVDEANSNVYHIVAGWRPNDPKGDGREQAAKIVIRDKNQTVKETAGVEEYTVIRRNWAIPVVNIRGVWFSKYNLRGDARMYEDQILVGTDPAAKAGKTLFEYLNTCTDEEYFQVIGSGYQSDSSKGLTLTYDGKWHFLDFVVHNSGLMSKVDKKSMAPDGFELPGRNDFRKLVWGENCGLTNKEYAGFTDNADGKRGHLYFKERQVSLNGGTMHVHLHSVYFSNSSSNTTPISDEFVWYGPGHQSDSEAEVGRYMFFATSADVDGLWILNCNGNNNVFQFVNYGANSNDKTHTIRCIKSPVDYQY